MAEDKTMLVLDELLAQSNLDKVTADGAGFQELPDGYYLCEVENTELKTTKSSGKPMVSMRFKVVEDGLKQAIDDDGNVELITASKTSGRLVFMNWVLTDTNAVERYVSDMLKFEDSEGYQLLQKDYFTNHSAMLDAFEVIKESRIYIMVQTRDRNGEKSKQYNIVKWATAKKLELPL